MNDTTEQARHLIRRAFWLTAFCVGAAAVGVGILLNGALAAPEAVGVSVSETPAQGKTGALPALAAPTGGPGEQASSPGEGPTSPPGADLEPLFAAIAAVESYNGRRPVGDGGRSQGPYHIGRAYWNEATRQGGVRWDYSTHVWSRPHCRQVMIWYWQRWCPEALRGGDLATLARTHNGGPGGPRKGATLPYWRRVQQAMTAQARPQRR